MTKNCKASKRTVIVALCCASSVLMCYSMITPVLAEISKSFPSVPASGIQMVFSVVALASLPGMFLAGALGALLSKKKLVSLGLLLMLGGGLLPTLLYSRLWMLYLSSGLVGLGMGFVNVLSAAMISEHFKGVEKGRVLGLQSAALSLGAAVFSMLGSRAAELGGWNLSFLVYLLGIPMLLIFLCCMPDTGKPKRGATGKIPFHTVFNQRAIRLALLSLVWNVFITGFQTNIALFIKEAQYGSVTLSGIVSTVFMLIGLPAGFAMGAYMKLFRQRSCAVALLSAALGMFLVAFSKTVAPVLLGTFLMGIAFSVYPPASISFMTSLVPEEYAAAGIAFHNTMGCAGKFLSPYVLSGLSHLTDGSFRGSFLIGGVGLALLGGVYLLANPVRAQDVE